MAEDPRDRLLRQLRELNSGKYLDLDEKGRRVKRDIVNPANAVRVRKRIKENGHWVPLDVRMENLERTRHRTAIQTQRKCAREGCLQPAVRNHAECRIHGGSAELLRRCLKDPDWKPKKRTALVRTFRAAVRAGAIPPEMAQSPIVREILDLCLSRLPDYPRDDFRFQDHMRRRGRAFRLLNEFATAYLALAEHGDPNLWVQAVGNARAAGFGK
jgi:hypothetical protein